MTKSIQQLRERRGALAKEARDLLEQHPGGQWGTEQQSKFDGLEGEITSLDQQIGNFQRVMDRDAEERVSDLGREREARNARDLAEIDPKRIFDTWMRNGDRALTPPQWEHVRNTMSTTTGSEGGYTVSIEVAKRVIEALKEYGGVREVSEVFRTQRGNDMQWPTSDGTSEVGELVAQNATATDLDISFGIVLLSVYKYSSKVVAIPIELLQDSEIDMESFIVRRLADRIGRITNLHFTIGTGVGQPKGVVTGASLGKVGGAGTGATGITYDELIDLIHSLELSYRRMNPRFMMADSSVKALRKIKDTAGRPIWTPSYDEGITRGTPETIAGYPVTINQDMAAFGVNAKSVLFGAFSYGMKIRDVMDVTMFRFTDSAFVKKGQVGFLSWMRCGGTVVDSAAIKYWQGGAT